MSTPEEREVERVAEAERVVEKRKRLEQGRPGSLAGVATAWSARPPDEVVRALTGEPAEPEDEAA